MFSFDTVCYLINIGNVIPALDALLLRLALVSCHALSFTRVC